MNRKNSESVCHVNDVLVTMVRAPRLHSKAPHPTHLSSQPRSGTRLEPNCVATERGWGATEKVDLPIH